MCREDEMEDDRVMIRVKEFEGSGEEDRWVRLRSKRENDEKRETSKKSVE